jgi:integrase
MADVYSRTLRTGDRVWYAEAHYWADGKRRRARRSTGIRDDGTVKSRRTAEVIARDIEQSLALGQGRVARPTTLAQAVDKLIEAQERAGRAQASIEIIVEKARHLADHFGATTPLEKCTDTLGYAKASLGVRKPDTVARELRTLVLAFKAVGMTPPSLPELAESIARERFLTREEQLKLLAATPANRRDYIICYLHLGLRKSELYRIHGDDCNFVTREVRIRGTKTDKSDRLIPMSPEVYDVLWSRRNDVPMFEFWHEGNADRELRKYAARAGLGPVSIVRYRGRTYRFAAVSFNDLRRTFATSLAAAGVPLIHLMHLMGHKSTRMLEKVYARVQAGEHMHEAIAKLAKLLMRPDPAKEA